MVKASLLLMLLLTVLIGMGLRWREARMGNPAITAQKQRPGARNRPGLMARGKASLDRWVTAAAIAAVATIALMGGLHWIRVWIG
ncbi:hypothetical protein [Roseomonas marmotae]|uniref:Uncharacterized protein n=1 Tax=Roseomonas marmotae TaxID=2768161 RepID=A0ABS3K693_9PROT|nr:hypothetical protein [Roseomonas marmotae]MBO1072989.1 hypothetical protein [Roseomonas marmotae]QTI79362.1 hypothetical protein IAI58_00535 [Roseomonas marmotae]